MSMLKKRSKERISISFPKFPPPQSVHDYFTSKSYFKKFTSFTPSYEWDKPGHDPIFHLFAGQRILQLTKQNLENKREWAKKEHKKLELQWEDLYNKELKLKETFKKLSNFIKSNEDKRSRAEKIREEDYELRMQRTRDIETLQKKIDLLIESKYEMESHIADLRLYDLYLNSVASISNDFVNADDLISRYEALVSTRNLLGKRQDESLRELESARAKTAKLVEENKFKILGLNNMVADLHSRYNTAFREALHWENIVLAIKKHSYEKYQEIIEVKESCWNVYLQMCRRKGEVPKIPEDDFEKQLIYIKKTLQELNALKITAHEVCANSTKKRIKIGRNFI